MSRINVSTLFLLPVTSIEEKHLVLMDKRGLKNSYCFCKEVEYEFPVLFLLFDATKWTNLRYNFINILKRNKNYIENFDMEEGYVMVFKIDPEFIEDYKLILNGAYSKTSSKYQNLFRKTDIVTRKGSVSKVYTMFYHVFNKTEFWKNSIKDRLQIPKDLLDDIELYDIPIREYETLKGEVVYG